MGEPPVTHIQHSYSICTYSIVVGNMSAFQDMKSNRMPQRTKEVPTKNSGD